MQPLTEPLQSAPAPVAPLAEETAAALVEAVRQAAPDALAVYVFGSRATGRTRPGSDLDLAVLLPRRRRLRALEALELQARLGQLAGCDVDLSFPRLDGGVVHAKEVVTTGRRLFVSDERAVDEFEMLVLSFYVDLRRQRAPVERAYSSPRGAPRG